MEQSPLSHSIRNLEADLGVALFHRTTRRTWLTRAGTRFYDEALRVLEAVEAAQAVARNAEIDGSQRLTIGLGEHAAGEPFARFLFELEQHNPPIAVDLREVNAGEAARQVSERTLDMAIVLVNVDVSGLASRRAWAENMALIVPLGHSLAESRRVSLAAVAGECLLSPSPSVSPGCAAQIEAVLQRHGVRPRRRATVKHQNTLTTLVSAGRGLALMPESVAFGLTTVAVLPLEEDDAALISWFLYREKDACDCLPLALEIARSIDECQGPAFDADREP